MEFRCPLGWPYTGRDSDRNRSQDDAGDCPRLHKSWDFTEVIDVRVEHSGAGQAVDHVLNVVEVVNYEKPFDHPRSTSNNAQGKAIR